MTGTEMDNDPPGYVDLLADLKARVRGTRFRAARAANTEVLRLHWSIGRDILQRQRESGWGSKVVDRLATDLKREFPEQRGWSRRNLLYMRKAAEVWPTETEFVHHVGARLPWRHVTVLLDRLATREERDWYAERAGAEGWSRAVLEHQIAMGLRGALGAAPSNFAGALDGADSELAQQLVKDPYVFEHLAYASSQRERDIEQALMDRLQDTLLEFGRHMTLVGRQYRLLLDDDAEFVMDLVLFHTRQLRYGQIHAPTVGILLCTGKSGATVQYSLASTAVPVAVADYRGLPADAREALPSEVELEAIVDAELRERHHDT